MKKIALIISLSVCLNTLSNGQFIIKATPFVLLKNQIVNVSGEFKTPALPNFSFTFGIANNFTIKENLQNTNPDLLIDLSKSSSGFSIEPGIRQYLLRTRSPFEGLYAGVYSSFRYGYSFYNEAITINNIQTPTMGTIQQNTLVSVVGLELGYQFLLGAEKNIAIDVFAGLGAKNTSYNRVAKNMVYYTVTNSTNQGISTRGNISIGYLIK